MKLLVNTPSGIQEVIEVGEGGGYFDPTRVIWDERKDGSLPAITLGGMVRTDNALTFSQTRLDAHNAAVLANVPKVMVVTRRQARQALVLNGKFDLVQPAIDAIPDATQRKLMQIEWDDSQVFERDRPSLIALGTAIGLTSAQIDNLFATAATL